MVVLQNGGITTKTRHKFISSNLFLSTAFSLSDYAYSSATFQHEISVFQTFPNLLFLIYSADDGCNGSIPYFSKSRLFISLPKF